MGVLFIPLRHFLFPDVIPRPYQIVAYNGHKAFAGAQHLDFFPRFMKLFIK